MRRNSNKFVRGVEVECPFLHCDFKISFLLLHIRLESNNNNRMKSESAILANGKVNVSLIEREIAHELGADAKYHAEDEMKKKAVHTSE